MLDQLREILSRRHLGTVKISREHEIRTIWEFSEADSQKRPRKNSLCSEPSATSRQDNGLGRHFWCCSETQSSERARFVWLHSTQAYRRRWLYWVVLGCIAVFIHYSAAKDVTQDEFTAAGEI